MHGLAALQKLWRQLPLPSWLGCERDTSLKCSLSRTLSQSLHE